MFKDKLKGHKEILESLKRVCRTVGTRFEAVPEETRDCGNKTMSMDNTRVMSSNSDSLLAWYAGLGFLSAANKSKGLAITS